MLKIFVLKDSKLDTNIKERYHAYFDEIKNRYLI